MIDWDAMLPPMPVAESDEPQPGDPAPSVGGVESSGLPGIDSPERRGDDRRYCTECENLNDGGRCLAAVRREIVASRAFTPVRDLLRRCEGFAPMPDDPDQRHGRDKWGWLRRYNGGTEGSQ